MTNFNQPIFRVYKLNLCISLNIMLTNYNCKYKYFEIAFCLKYCSFLSVTIMTMPFESLKFYNPMNFQDQNNQNTQSQLNISFCPTFAYIQNIQNSPKLLTRQNTKAPKNDQIDQNQLRLRILQFFRKDKVKYNNLCEKFIYLLQSQDHCQNIKNFIEFIQQTSVKDIKTKFVLNGSETKTKENSQKYEIRLAIFSTHGSFLASIFSRDKLNILLRVHSIYQKIQNFLHFLYISLQSISFTNQREWILMKDQIQRYLMKYEKNVNKLLEISQIEISESNQEEEVSSNNTQGVQGKKSNKNLKKKQKKSKLFNEVFTSSNQKLRKQFNLIHYRRDIGSIKKKLKQLQINFCSAISTSFRAWFEKFQVILDQHKEDLGFICHLLDKAQLFQKSAQKDQIIQFLLLTRSKGIEGIIFMEQIYKCILIKLQETRLQLSYNISLNVNRKFNFQDLTQVNFSYKQQSTKEVVDKMFRKFEHLLNLKVQRTFVGKKHFEILDESESQNLEKTQETSNTKLFDYQEKKSSQKIQLINQPIDKKILKKTGPCLKSIKIKKDKNIVVQHSKQRKLQQKSRCLKLDQRIDNSSSMNQQSSSLQFLVQNQNYKIKSPNVQKLQQQDLSQKKNFSIQAKKKVLENNHYEQIQSLSIERGLHANFGSDIENCDSNIDGCVMGEKRYTNDYEVQKKEGKSIYKQ